MSNETLVERLKARSFRLATKDFNGDGAKLALEAAARISTLEAQLRDVVLECSRWAQKAGEAEGVLEASEMAGIVEGWQQRCFKAEARLAEAREAARENAMRELAALGQAQEAYEASLQAREAERAAVVAWLRGDDTPEAQYYAFASADAIERGDHLTAPETGCG